MGNFYENPQSDAIVGAESEKIKELSDCEFRT